MATILLGVTSDELRALDLSFGGRHEMNGNVDTVFQSARDYGSNFWDRVAMVVRSIAGGHLFDNGNKRTALASVQLFRKRNKIVTGALEPEMRETVRLVAIGQLSEIPQIARSLRGF